MPGKRPSMQWYTGDWLKDPAVRSVSFAARGLWVDMLNLMFESARKGFLELNRKPVSPAQLARMTGGSVDEVSGLLAELEECRVFSRSDDGVIYCRRMVRDERERDRCREGMRRLRSERNVTNRNVTGNVTGVLRTRYANVEEEEEEKSKPPPQAGKDRGAGERKPSGLPFDCTPEGLAQRWCFDCSRKKRGFPADQEQDMAAEFAELIRLGHKPEHLLRAVLDEKRDRGEHFWQFKQRFTRHQTNGHSNGQETLAKRIERQQRERSQRSESH